jgi:Zn-dependent metalloprotease
MLLPIEVSLAQVQQPLTGKILIYNAGIHPLAIISVLKKGNLVLEDGKKKALIVPRAAYGAQESITAVKNYFYTVHGRNSWDNKGADIHASVNIGKWVDLIYLLGENAAWISTPPADVKIPENLLNRFMIGAGSKKGLSNFQTSIDVLGHEYTHAIISSIVKLNPISESGALNEHLADVFGVLSKFHHKKLATQNSNILIQDEDFLLGTTVVGTKYTKKGIVSLRNMLHPKLEALDVQPEHMSELEDRKSKYFRCIPNPLTNDNCYVHKITGVPNRMAANFIKAVGPEVAEKFFYEFMTTKLKLYKDESELKISFRGYARLLRQLCQEKIATYKESTCNALEIALNLVGLDTTKT